MSEIDRFRTERQQYLRDILTKVVAGHPINRIDELLPWNYATANAVTPAP